MADGRWMIYGANGYTGRLVANEAKKRGHEPILAGRSAQKIEPIARELGLPWKAVDLTDESALAAAVADVDVVYHAAGPFTFTSAPMVRACLAGKTSYVDITGENNVIEATYALDEQAKAAGVVLIPAGGFDVVPTDCMVRYVADQIENPRDLELGIYGLSKASAGTTKTMLEGIPYGGFIRRDGKIRRSPLGELSKTVRFPTGTRQVFSAPFADVVTAPRTAGVTNVTAYAAMPPSIFKVLRVVKPLIGITPIRRAIQAIAGRTVQGPDEAMRRTARTYIWARVANADGASAEAWLDTLEAYELTAQIGVRIVEKILSQHPVGALTPAGAFGADLILELESTKRYDTLLG